MTHDPVERLQAFVDGELSLTERQAVAAHLSGCADCREVLARIQRQSNGVALRLAVLDPQRTEKSAAAPALARFRHDVMEAQPSTGTRLSRRWDMIRNALQNRWRPVAATLTVAVAITAVLTIAPLRAAVADFLSLFRVQQFTAISVSPERIEQVSAILENMDSGNLAMLGEPTIVREPAPPQTVADVNEAAALAGFTPRVPTALPADATLKQVVVEGGPALRMEGDWALAQMVLAQLGIDGSSLPQSGTAIVEVDIPTAIRLQYGWGDVEAEFVQLPAPTATMPDGVSPAVLGEVFLRGLGMPAADAQRLASTIDWTSTAVLPIPSNVARFQEIAVDGVTGLLLEQEMTAEDENGLRGRIVVWQRDGMVYAIAGEGVSSVALLQLADSLR